jgi:hypothetical protein
VVKDVEPKDGQSKSNIIFFLDATVQCWMLDKEDVVISVFTLPDAANPESIEAEAEIDLQDLSAIRGGVAADSESDSVGENKSIRYMYSQILLLINRINNIYRYE